MTTPADDAEDALERATETTDKENGTRWALVGIGYAVLDLAAALREEPDHGNEPLP